MDEPRKHQCFSFISYVNGRGFGCGLQVYPSISPFKNEIRKLFSQNMGKKIYETLSCSFRNTFCSSKPPCTCRSRRKRMIFKNSKNISDPSLMLWAVWDHFQGGSLCLTSSVCWFFRLTSISLSTTDYKSIHIQVMVLPGVKIWVWPRNPRPSQSCSSASVVRFGSPGWAWALHNPCGI